MRHNTIKSRPMLGKAKRKKTLFNISKLTSKLEFHATHSLKGRKEIVTVKLNSFSYSISKYVDGFNL